MKVSDRFWQLLFFLFLLVLASQKTSLVECFLEVSSGGGGCKSRFGTALYKTTILRREPYSLGLRPFLVVKAKPDVSNLTQDILSHRVGLWIQEANHHLPHSETAPTSVTLQIAVVHDASPNVSNHEMFNVSTLNGTLHSDPRNTSSESTNVTVQNSTLNATMEASTSETVPSASSVPSNVNTTKAVKPKAAAEYNPPWSGYLANLNLNLSYFNKKQDANANVANIASVMAAPATSTSTLVSSSSLPSSTSSSSTTSSSSSPTAMFDLNSKKRSDLLTLQDLESILLTNKFVRESDLKKFAESQRQTRVSSSATLKAMDSSSSSASTISSSKSRIAFPQPTTLDAKTLQWGCIISASLSTMIIVTSLVPNLWLMGLLVGGLYGSEVGKRQQEEEGEELVDSPATDGPLSSLVLYLGRRLALAYLKVFYTCNTIFFMYKTGQLSYEYYKTYASLDQRFAIQKKVDAWNDFFVEGKIAFDKWEKENEVGRKILAGLRTAWFIEERSLKRRSKRQSKYRLIQFVFDIEDFARRLVRSLWKAVTGGGSSELQDFLKGLRIDMSESGAQQLGSRIGSVLAALVAVNLMGVLFALSPFLLSALAILVGVAWPTWAYEFYDRVEQFVEETLARGRGEQPAKNEVDKSNYHYYVQENGKKRYYRTGRPWFDSRAPGDKRKHKNRKNQSDGSWDWRILRRD